jgi:TonB family protein
MSELPGDPYFNGRRSRIILVTVFFLHAAIIAVPLIYASLTDYFDPPVIVMKVGMADLPPGDAPDAGEVAQNEPQQQVNEPDPVPVDSIPDPKKLDPLPDLPPDPPPVVKTPDPTPVVTPPKKDPPKTEPKKDPPKKDPPKTEPKKDPPKSTLLKPEDIKKTPNTKTQAQLDAERKAREAAEAKAKADAKAREDLIASIRNAATQGTAGTPNPGREGILATKEMRDYYEQLNAFIRPQWNAVSPSSVELGGKVTTWPVVDLTIAKNGTVSKAVIVSKSGNKAVDEAVDALLAKMKVVPAPPQAGVIRVTLDIR